MERKLTPLIKKQIKKAYKSIYPGVDTLQYKVKIKKTLDKYSEDGVLHFLFHSTDCDGTSGVCRRSIPATVVHWEKFYWDARSNAEGRFSFEYYKPSGAA